MAFKKELLSAYGNIEKAGIAPVLWVYYNKDGDTVTTSGYLAHDAVHAKDQVLVIAANGATQAKYYVSAVANGAATLTAQS